MIFSNFCIFSLMSYEWGMRGKSRGLNPAGEEICPAIQCNLFDKLQRVKIVINFKNLLPFHLVEAVKEVAGLVNVAEREG